MSVGNNAMVNDWIKWQWYLKGRACMHVPPHFRKWGQVSAKHLGIGTLE